MTSLQFFSVVTLMFVEMAKYHILSILLIPSELAFIYP